jgi:hypothetical protein
MNKKLIQLMLLCAVLSTTVLFTACKKGENDPGISLRSRKSRVVGEWKLRKGTVKSVSNGSVETTTYDNDKGTIADNLGTDKFTYSMEYIFEKDGTYKYTATETYDGDTPSIEKGEGTWSFVEKNKSADLRNKEAILLTSTNYSYSYNGNSSTSTDSNPTDGEMWIIDELSNDVMVVKYASKSTSNSGGSSTSFEIDAELTFWAK